MRSLKQIEARARQSAEVEQRAESRAAEVAATIVVIRELKRFGRNPTLNELDAAGVPPIPCAGSAGGRDGDPAG